MSFSRLRIAVVGDVHDCWDPVIDEKALRALEPNLVLFTGDFGDENVELVEQVSCLDFPKAIILGNHDCWFTSSLTSSNSGNAVQLQLQSLGDSHVAYSRIDFPELKISIVGGRPFSSGGSSLGPARQLISERYGIRSMKESAKRISKLALEAPIDHALVFLAHDGPTGLGSNPQDICGKDWSTSSGDHGDPDLAEAINYVKEKGSRKVQLVAFGHMHKKLCNHRGFRTMLVVGSDNTIYVNAAVVPRIRTARRQRNGIFSTGKQSGETKRNFTLVEMVDGEVDEVSEVWISVGEDAHQEEKTVLFSLHKESTSSGSSSVR